MKTAICAVALLALAGLAVSQSTRPKPNYKVTRLSQSEVAISCLNGADPTGKKVGDTLILSCGR